MLIKKLKAKAFHNGNRLNGNGSNNRASYGVFDNGELIGKVIFATVYDAYSLDGKTRLNRFATSTLKALKEQLA